LTKPNINNLSGRVEKLSKLNHQAAQNEFERRWQQLSDDEQRLARETLGEFGALKDTGQMSTEEQAQKWYDNLPPEKRAVMMKMPDWDEQ
jgi:hypothetical protein